MDIKGFPEGIYLPTGRNAGKIKYVHGGVSRNVVEISPISSSRPPILGIVDDSALRRPTSSAMLQNHKVNTEYMRTIPKAWETWLAVFDHNGDLAGSVSQRPNLMPILDNLEEKGDEIFCRGRFRGRRSGHRQGRS